MAKTDQELAQEELNSLGVKWEYGGDRSKMGPITASFVGERREVLRPEQSMFVGFDAKGDKIYETIPAQYGRTEKDSSYAPASRTMSFLRDLAFGDANEQGAAASQVVTALKSIPEYLGQQYKAGMAGGRMYDEDTNQIVEFDPTTLPTMLAPAGVMGVMRAPSNTMTLGSMGSRARRRGMTLEEGQADAMNLLDEALEAPIEDFKPLEGAPKFSGPLDPAGTENPSNTWAIVTAENPPNTKGVTDEFNRQRTRNLGEYLIKRYGADNVSLVKGDYGGAERSFLVQGIDPISARNIGDKYGQDSVFTDRGLIYTRGNPEQRGEGVPIKPRVDSMGRPDTRPNVDPNLESFYTEMDTGSGESVRFGYDLEENTGFTTPLGRPAASSSRGVHFSNESGLTELDPARFGTGHKGKEYQRVGQGLRSRGEGPLRSYLYTPSGRTGDVIPESVVPSSNRYETTLRKLYDAETDPEGLFALAKNPSDFERMVEARGFRGILSPSLADPKSGRSGSAAMFKPTPVTSIDSAERLGGVPPK